jgi:hypothetical protein
MYHLSYKLSYGYNHNIYPYQYIYHSTYILLYGYYNVNIIPNNTYIVQSYRLVYGYQNTTLSTIYVYRLTYNLLYGYYNMYDFSINDIPII